MRYRVLFIVWLSCIVFAYAETVMDTLPDVEVSVSRIAEPVVRQQMQVSVLDARMMEAAVVTTPKEAASLAPNIYMPDYGSAMTSSIYVRGLGSRINESVMGVVVDGVPLLDKNMYDYTLQDVKRIELLRGPQGALYGRNSPGGIMEIRTIQPLDVNDYVVRARVGYSSANTVQAQASFYGGGWGIAARYGRTDGFYRNAFNGRKIDSGQQAGGRVVYDCRPNDYWRVTSSVTADWVEQGAFPYADARSGVIDFNRSSGYERLALLPSVRAEYMHQGYRLLLSGSYQFMHDDMRMDQDYTRADIFTLRQTQRQHNASFDAILYAPKPVEWYEWTVGVSGIIKTNRMSAPVTFMREGIETLILANANNGIRTAFPTDSISIRNTVLPIRSRFQLLNAGVAAYHQSHFRVRNWHFNASVRIDYENARMRYTSEADVDYLFTLMMNDYKTLHTRIHGVKEAHYVQVLPRVAVSYESDIVTVYGYVAEGFKAGGYNPQMFSTVTQNRVMTDMAADMGIHLQMADPRFTDVAVTEYRPQTDWTFELGAHLTPVEGLKIDVAAFHIRSYNQQVTVFPTGKTTGRMMANAARSRVWGAEAALHYRWSHNRWFGLLHAAYGFADARFIRFNDGIGDYSNHFIPYAPQHTAHAMCNAGYRVGHKALQAVSLTLKGDGIGRIWWNEQNDRSQPLYGLLGATLTLEWKYVQLQLWARNLTDTRYDVFYFRSMDNDFLQRGRPREMGIEVKVEF